MRSLSGALALAFSVMLLASAAGAQTTAENLDKYHALRARLLTEFTVVGENAGQSQPADLRDDGEGFIKWADSTIRLGWYLGVLATEHHLYAHPELYPGAQMVAPEATLDELYAALLALERLDLVADAAFPECGPSPPSLNGYFIRDDVPDGFHQSFPPLTITYSDFVDPVLTNKEMSQDQVYHLLMGLALVRRYVPAGVSVQGRELAPWAIEQARRIIEHVSSNDWSILNPACDRLVNRGPAASGFSGGTRLAIGFITGGAFVPDASEVWIDIWSTAKETTFAAYLDIDNRHMAMAIAAVGDGWGASTSEDLARLGDEPDWPFYTMLHRALHGDAAVGWCTTGEAVNDRAREMLDELPLGADIASPQPSGPAPHGFTRSNRFMRGRETAYTGEQGSDGYRFNGLDYMLLHNLYALATPATWQGGGGPGVPACSAPAPGEVPRGDPEAAGCACRSAPASGSWWLVALLLWPAALMARRDATPRRRRERTHASRPRCRRWRSPRRERG